MKRSAEVRAAFRALKEAFNTYAISTPREYKTSLGIAAGRLKRFAQKESMPSYVQKEIGYILSFTNPNKNNNAPPPPTFAEALKTLKDWTYSDDTPSIDLPDRPRYNPRW